MCSDLLLLFRVHIHTCGAQGSHVFVQEKLLKWKLTYFPNLAFPIILLLMHPLQREHNHFQLSSVQSNCQQHRTHFILISMVRMETTKNDILSLTGIAGGTHYPLPVAQRLSLVTLCLCFKSSFHFPADCFQGGPDCRVKLWLGNVSKCLWCHHFIKLCICCYLYFHINIGSFDYNTVSFSPRP